jgi:Carboxypeptidase regulatory-like domain
MRSLITKFSRKFLCLALASSSAPLAQVSAPQEAQAQSANANGSIECEVKNSKGASTRAVVVLHADGTAIQSTNQDGRIAFPALPAGKYEVAFCADGFYPELRNVRVKSGKVTRVRVRLRASGTDISGCEGLAKPQ